MSVRQEINRQPANVHIKFSSTINLLITFHHCLFSSSSLHSSFNYPPRPQLLSRECVAAYLTSTIVPPMIIQTRFQGSIPTCTCFIRKLCDLYTAKQAVNSPGSCMSLHSTPVLKSHNFSQLPLALHVICECCSFGSLHQAEVEAAM